MSLAPIPSLDQLAAEPARAAQLPPEVARDLLLRLAPLQEALRLRALNLHASVHGQPETARKTDPT